MAYITVAEYISRFGERETILLTNEQPGSSTFTSRKVEEAIDDADDVVEAYIGTRYVVPVVSPPSVLRGWTAALAREALFVNTGKLSDTVKEAADRARAQLRDVQAGRMSLPIPEGGTALETANNLGLAASSNDREPALFTRSTMDAFTVPFGGGYNPCWRRGQ